MPDTDLSPNLGLPFYQTKLNEFEVQHNEALLVLDALVMLSVIDRDHTAPPAGPSPGDRYLVKATATGDFAGKENRIAQYDTGGWNFYAPRAGWTCYAQDEQALLAFNGETWEAALDVLGGVSELQDLSLLGIGTEADGDNPLSAKLNNVLWTARTVAEGGDGTLRYKLSKEDESKTLSLLFQDGYSGRAEIGLTGDDDLRVKVSADGTTWLDAIVIDRTTGEVSLPQTPPAGAPADLELTFAELALGLADALNCAQFLGDAGNRFADSFDTLTHVDTGGSTNLNTATAGLLKPSATSDTFGTIVDPTLSANQANATQYTIRQLIPASATASVSGDKVRVTFTAATTGDATGITAAYIGHVGTAPNFDGNQVQLTFNGGSASASIPAGQSLTSDPVTFAYDETKDLIVAVEYTAATDFRNGANTGYTEYYKAGETGTAGSTTVSGYSPNANSCYVVDSVEIRTAAGSTQNMAAKSAALTAAAAPTSMKAVVRAKFVDAVTLGTHYKLSVSRDGGTTWSYAAMNDRFTVNNLHVLESDTIDVSSQPAGTSVKWRIETTGNKMAETHDLYLYWT